MKTFKFIQIEDFCGESSQTIVFVFETLHYFLLTCIFLLCPGTLFRYSLSTSENFRLDEVLYSSLKLESIAWHPQADQAGNNSAYAQMFASIEKFNHMCIIDLSIKVTKL